MMVGNRYYSEADMMRMQRDAEERVREMRNRTRQTAGDEGASFIPAFAAPPGGRNWSSGPNTGRRNSPRGRQNPAHSTRIPNTKTQNEAAQGDFAQNKNAQNRVSYDNISDNGTNIPDQEVEKRNNESYNDPDVAQAPDAEKSTTIVEDIVGSLGIDADTLLIIGLILILVNQKADTTLILALAYLLI